MTVVKADDYSLLVAVDVAHPSDNKERLHLGADLGILDHLHLRGGYRFGYDLESATFGAGVAVPVGDSNITIDYAYAVYDLLPGISRFTVGLGF
jgi:hypothetical protein